MAVVLKQGFKFLDGIAEEVILGQDGTLLFPTFLNNFMFAISRLPFIFARPVFLLFFEFVLPIADLIEIRCVHNYSI